MALGEAHTCCLTVEKAVSSPFAHLEVEVRGVFPATGEDDGDILRFQLGLGEGVAVAQVLAVFVEQIDGAAAAALGNDVGDQRIGQRLLGAVYIGHAQQGVECGTVNGVHVVAGEVGLGKIGGGIGGQDR